MEEREAGTYPPLVKTVEVPLPAADAFSMFTIGIARWWPLRTHSVAKDRATTCVFEEGVGGRIYESDGTGTEHEWGRVLEWEPPRRVVYSWYPSRAATTAQTVEVTFSPAESGTVVELTHRGWETLADTAAEQRADYDSGWDFVLGHFVEHAGH